MNGYNDTISEEDVINHARKRAGMPPVVQKERACLQCGESFPSRGAHNRICVKCKEKERAEGDLHRRGRT